MRLLYTFFLFLNSFDLIQVSANRKSPSTLIQEIVNFQTDCHVHIVNPNEESEVQITGSMTNHITINSRCKGQYDFWLFELLHVAKNLSFATSTQSRPFVDMDDKYEYAIEKEISKCERTVYADISEDVDREFEYFKKKYPHIKFFKSKETLLETKQLWKFPELFVGSKMLYRVKQMFENGIHSLLNKVLLLEITSRKLNKTNSKDFRENAAQNGPQAIALSDKVQSSFVIYLICLATCAALILIEMYYVKFQLQLSFKNDTVRNFCGKHTKTVLQRVEECKLQPQWESFRYNYTVIKKFYQKFKF